MRCDRCDEVHYAAERALRQAGRIVALVACPSCGNLAMGEQCGIVKESRAAARAASVRSLGGCETCGQCYSLPPGGAGLRCPLCDGALQAVQNDQPGDLAPRTVGTPRVIEISADFSRRLAVVPSADPASVTRLERRVAGRQLRAAVEPSVEEDADGLIAGWELLEHGTVVEGRYTIVRLIAHGGSGVVYEAICPGSPDRVAIKVLRRAFAEREATRLRFSQEARLIALIHHPNVVRYLGHGALPDERPYLVMEMLEGGCLFDRLTDGGPIPAPDAFRAFGQICAALEAVHAHGIVHRDLKPDNVILSRSGDAPMAKLIDFGISKVFPHGEPALTGEGLFIGSPSYMAPEQIESAVLDARTDIYALGLMMYEVFTDDWPWAVPRSDTWQQLRAHAELKPRRDRRFEHRCRPLSDLVMRCIEKVPGRRPASALEVRKALSALEPYWPLPYVGNPDIHRKLKA
jgi:hypothetical protein